MPHKNNKTSPQRVEDLLGKLENTLDDCLDVLNDYDKDSMTAYYVDEFGKELSKEIATRRGLNMLKDSLRGLRSTLGDYDKGKHMRALTVGSVGTDATRPFNI